MSWSASHSAASGCLSTTGSFATLWVAQRLAQHEAALEQFHLRLLEHRELGDRPRRRRPVGGVEEELGGGRRDMEHRPGGEAGRREDVPGGDGYRRGETQVGDRRSPDPSLRDRHGESLSRLAVIARLYVRQVISPVSVCRRRKSANDGSKPPFRPAYPHVTIRQLSSRPVPRPPAGPRHRARPPARISPDVPQDYLPTPRAGGYRRGAAIPSGRERGGGGVSPGGSRPGHTSSAPKGETSAGASIVQGTPRSMAEVAEGDTGRFPGQDFGLSSGTRGGRFSAAAGGRGGDGGSGRP